MRTTLRVTLATIVLGLVSLSLIGVPAEASPTQTRCTVPVSGTKFGTATPQQEALDPAAVQRALNYANSHLRLSVQIFRNNCLIGTGALNPVTANLPMELFSSTKSVISMLTGIAYDRHKLSLDDPIGKYLPKGVGWGDPAHRAITIRNLLTETAGLREAILAEFASLGADPNIAQEALAQPLVAKPGTKFEYTQRVPDLLGFVVQRAVGQDLQKFAQANLFSPVGIPRTSYSWLRDRAGITYGYANLFMPPTQFAKLGLLMQNDGVWNGKRVISSSYVHKVQQPTATNGCYGMLFWVNSGTSCTSANIPAAQTVEGPAIASAPRDLYAMVGALQQNNFIIPSLNMTVTWTGVLGETALNLAGILSASASGSDLYYNFFRLLMAGVKDQKIPDPGPFKTPPLDLDVNPLNYLSPFVLLTDLFPSAKCNVLGCNNPGS